MKLKEIHKLRYRAAILYLQKLWYSMLLNVLYEYAEMITIWRKTLTYIGEVADQSINDDKQNSEITLQRVLSYIKRLAYVDLNDNRLYPNRPLFLTQLYIALSVLRAHRLTQFFPVDFHVKATHRTTREDYKKENSDYRLAHRVANDGFDLKKRPYEKYKYIAKKYNWPIVLNSDDAEA